MRLKFPRVAPLPEFEWTAEQREILAPMAERGRVINIFKTLIRNPTAYKAFMAYGGYVLSKRNSLGFRERELVILRTGYLCASGYEWAQHAPIGERAGLTHAEIERIKAGPDAPEWSALDRALLQATDELFRDKFIATPTWSALKAHLSEEQIVNLIFSVGQYTQVSMLLNSLGVQLDEGQTLDPALARYEP